MSETMEIWASRIKNADPATYVGEVNRIFYYPDSGTLRISDGSTPGGLPINLIGNLTDIAIGNFVFNGSSISTSTPDANIVIDINGTGNVQIQGPLQVYADGNISSPPQFSVKPDGQVTMLVPGVDALAGAVEIVGSTSGVSVPPQTEGAMLHVTGNNDKYAAILLDSVGNVPVYVARRYNGTAASPTPVLDGDITMVVGSSPYGSDGFPSFATGWIQWVADGDQTASNYGSNVEIWTTPPNSTTAALAVKFNGDSMYANNINATGRVDVQQTGNVGSNAALNVTRNESGLTRVPVLEGSIAQFTARDNQVGYIVIDGYGNVNSASTGSQVVFRAARGTNAAPEAVQDNDVLGEITGAGWGTTGYGGVSAASISLQADGAFSDSSRPGKVVIRAIPPNSITPQEVVSINSSDSFYTNGHRLSNVYATLAAGTSSQAPLIFSPGTPLTTPSPGALNYDGRVFLATPTGTDRGLIPSQQEYVLNATRNLTVNITTPQSIFGVGVSLSANTRYFYHIFLKIAKSGPQLPVLFYGLDLSGGATAAAHRYWVTSSSSATDAGISAAYSMSNRVTTAFGTGVAVTPAWPADSPAYGQLEIRGYIDMSVAGLVTPQLAFNPAPNQAISVQPQSSMIIYPLGTTGSNTVIGNWS